MPLTHLEHFLIQTADLDGTRDWYAEVLGMVSGPHPDFKIPVHWMYLGDEPVLHLAEGGAEVSENRMKYLGQQSTAVSGSGVVDHVAFRATGLQDMINHLDAKDPNDVKVELNFANEEALEIQADIMAADLPD